MTRNVKWNVAAIVLLLMVATKGMAQMSKEFLDANYNARNNITLPLPVIENNTLPVAPANNLYSFPSSPKKVIVAALLRPGDYSNYYKGNTNVTTPNLWVFEPNHTKNRFQRKVPAPADRTWQRFCQFLGLDVAVAVPAQQRDTIIYLEVELKDLFRPAYITDIHKPVTSKNPNKLNSSDRYIIDWFKDQQYHNIYPWTRLGYTYDWGDATDHVGATEFILKSGTYPIKKFPTTSTRDYDTVAQFLQ